MVKREDYYLEVYTGPYKEVVEVYNSYKEGKVNAEYCWESRREKRAVLLVRKKLEDLEVDKFADRWIEIGEGYPVTKEELERAIELYDKMKINF